MTRGFEQCAADLVEAGRFLYERGLVPATSGNLSARLDNGDIAITVSGRHKGRLQTDDIMRIDPAGQPLEARKPSAETGLHLQIYQHDPGVQMVLHHHSLVATLSSRLADSDITLQGYELLKAFPGIGSHEVSMTVPVFDNDQDIPRLVARVAPVLDAGKPLYGYLIRGHGLYTWADGLENALKHVEAYEFLLKCELVSTGAINP